MPSMIPVSRGPRGDRAKAALQPDNGAAGAALASPRQRGVFGRAAKASALALFLMASAAVLPAGGGLAGAAHAQTTAAQAKAELTRQLDAIVTEDARRWLSNRYVRGSMRNVEIRNVANNGKDFVIVGDYTYNGSLRGQVAAKVVGGRVSCLEFHDFPGMCRPPNRPTSVSIMGDFFEGALSGGGGAGGGGGNGGGGYQQPYDPHEYAPTPYTPPPPAYSPPPPPIDPFYGDCHGSMGC